MDRGTTAGDLPTSLGNCCAATPGDMFCENGWFPVALSNTGDVSLSGCAADEI